MTSNLTINNIVKQQIITFHHELVEIINYINQISKPKVIITDRTIYQLHKNFFKKIDKSVNMVFVERGEEGKNISSYQTIFKKLLEYTYTRQTTLVAIGGGSILDLCGMIAGTYKRGIDLISIPTTVIAQTDACCGGKCGLNIGLFKNQCGMYYLAKQILICPVFLKTLPDDVFYSGFAEILKYGYIYDLEILPLIDRLDETNKMLPLELLKKCIDAKCYYINKDYTDDDIRQTLNYGHTIGHALESYHKFKLSHGISVAYGMYYETGNYNVKKSIEYYMQKFNLIMPAKVPFHELHPFLINDKKWHTEQMIKITDIKNIGQSTLKSITIKELERIYNE